MNNSPNEDRLEIGGGAAAAAASNDREELLESVMASNDDGAFKPLKTIPAFSIHLFISTMISLIGVVLAIVWPESKRCDAYFLMLFLRTAFWLITCFFDYIVKRHHEDLRLNGYHDFHRSTALHKGTPLLLVSLWNSTLLSVQALVHYYYAQDFWKHCAGIDYRFTPITYVTAFNITESVILAAIYGKYIAKVKKFNQSTQPPDALRGENRASGSLGVNYAGANTSELLEKQADLIAYLKDHNDRLNQRLHQMQLTARTVNLST